MRDCNRLGCPAELAVDEAADSLEAQEKLASFGSLLAGVTAALASSSSASSSCWHAQVYSKDNLKLRRTFVSMSFSDICFHVLFRQQTYPPVQAWHELCRNTLGDSLCGHDAIYKT